MAFLLDHLPPQVHLVIATPRRPGAARWRRLRARGELVEIRAARPALHARRGRGVPERGDGPGPDRAGRRGAGGAHRGLDRRAPAGGALDAGARRRRRLHRRLRRGRPLHRRLPGRGGPPAPARPRPELPAADVGPGPAERPAVRCRHRPGRRQGDARGAGPGEPVPGPARRPSPVVPLPPPVRRRAACAPAGRASPTRCPSCTGGRATGTSRTANDPRPSATRWPARTSTRAADLVELAIPAMRRVDRRPRCSGWLDGTARRVCPRAGPCSASVTLGRCCPAASSRTRGPPAGRRAVARGTRVTR